MRDVMQAPSANKHANAEAGAAVINQSNVDTLPLAGSGADLPRVKLHQKWVALCFGLTLAIYLAWVPTFLNVASPPTGDQPFYLMDAISILQDGDLNVKNNYEPRPDGMYDFDKFYALAPHPPGFIGMGAPYPLPPQIGPTVARPANEWYGAHLPGLAVAILPAWVIGSWFALWWPATVVFMCIVSALVAVNVFLLAHELTGKLWIAFAVWIPIAFSSPVMSYSFMLFTELSTGLLAIYAVRRLAMGWGANGPIRLTLVGLCIGYMPWLAWRAVPIAIMVGLYAVVQWWRYWRSVQPRRGTGATYERQAESRARNSYPRRFSPWFKTTSVERMPEGGDSGISSVGERRKPGAIEVEREQLTADGKGQRPVTARGVLLSAAWALMPLAISGVLLASYNSFLYGSLVPTSMYGSAAGDPNFALFWPWGGQDSLIKYMNAILGLLFDQQFGLLPYAPIYVLVAVGAIAMFRSARRSDRRLLVWLAIVAVPYMAVVAAYAGWSGVWCPPARYLTTFAPLMGAPLAMSLYTASRRRVTGTLYGGVYAMLALPGLYFMWLMMSYARLMWPIPRGALFDWIAKAPESLVKVDILKFIPANVWPDPFKQAQLTGWAVGLSVGIVFLGYALMPRSRAVKRTTTRGIRRWPIAAHGVAWLGAVGVLAYVWFMANYKFLEHKTELAQVRAWPLSQPAGGGVSLWGNKLYISDYAGGNVGTLDLGTGAYELMKPRLADGTPLSFFHPSDPKIGPDGLLYVLNNGPGDQGLLGLQLDGQVVKQITLNGKTPIGIGLVFAPDNSGTTYVSDMTGGRVLKYGPNFGDPLEAYGGEGGGFDNTAGIAVDNDGTIYAIESSPPTRVQQLDRNGKFVRDFKLECMPQFIVINGDWLDVTCGASLVSIDRVSGKVQSERYTENSLNLVTPTGLTYGPGGTLYVLDVDKVIEYTVKH